MKDAFQSSERRNVENRIVMTKFSSSKEAKQNSYTESDGVDSAVLLEMVVVVDDV